MFRILTIVGVAILVAIAFAAGRLSVRDASEKMTNEQTNSAPPTATQARIERMPDDVWLHYVGPSKEAGAAGISRTTNMEKVVGIGVYNPNKSILFSEFFPDTGYVKSLSFKNGRKYVREWSFREDGSLEIETIYKQDGKHGTRTYFAPDGTKEREEHIVAHNV